MSDARRAYPSGLSDAEDVRQDAYTAILARLEACRPAARFHAWPLQSIHNRAVDARRRRGHATLPRTNDGNRTDV